MSAVTQLSRWVARAIVIEQLNEVQWHAVAKGWDVPEGSFEDHASAVNTFDIVVGEALDKAEVTGLPILVEAHLDVPRPLADVIDLAAWLSEREAAVVRTQHAGSSARKRPTLDETMGWGIWTPRNGGDAA